MLQPTLPRLRKCRRLRFLKESHRWFPQTKRKLLKKVRISIKEPCMHQPAESTPSLSALVLAQPESALVSNAILRSNGFEVKEALDISSASELFLHRRFDLAVYDDSVDGAMELAGSRRSSSLPRVSIGLLVNVAR